MYEMQTPDTLARPENPNPKWPVPKNLIELQPSYKQASLAYNLPIFCSNSLMLFNLCVEIVLACLYIAFGFLCRTTGTPIGNQRLAVKLLI